MEENTKLEEQLKKDLVTCIQGENNINDILSSKKEVVAKDGVWFARMKNKSKGGNAKKGKTLPPNNTSNFNPSDVLCHASDGNVFAKFVLSPYEYIEWSIWVPKSLLLT